MASEAKSELVSQLKKLIENKKMVIGSSVTLKELKKGTVKRVFLSSNIPKKDKDDMEHYAKLSKAEVVETGISNEELGIICKKSFLISVLSEKK